MKKTILLFLVINFSVSHAETIETYPSNKDSSSLDSIQKVEVEKSVWVVDTKRNNKNNITEFQAKYYEPKLGVSVIYVIPSNLDNQSALNNEIGSDICKSKYVRFEFNQKKFNENNINLNSGRIWVNNSNYFSANQSISNQFEDDRYLDVGTEDFDVYLRTESNLKITFDNERTSEITFKDVFDNFKKVWNPTFDVWIPFTGAKAQIAKAQNACIESFQIEKAKLTKAMKEKEDAETLAKQEIDRRKAEIDRQNAEIKRQLTAQMKKPDVQIGMTRQQVLKNTRWGTPMKINSTRTKYGTSEQWVYWGYKYLYFENGELVAIQQ
ncbi:cell envelope integrity protein TolA [Acinetobacter venetianus]|uniref:cell envelope integrity protein TolA n=1 Tax=Acinetobacter venetianus TaxID=52133 RepID=UPI00215062EA|nr:cell envelope integrity protein TolA [Acinetobacter venetianus]MCR4532452.1 hypothetical protein [Acinetobacter venetianus]